MVPISRTTSTISPVLPSAEPSKSPQRQFQQQLQDTFSAVLASQDLPGYKSSADYLSAINLSSESLNESVSEQWNSWLTHVRTERYSSVKNLDAISSTFETVLIRANQEAGYASPIGFLQSLNEDELDAIQAIHHLVEPIEPTGLTTEGAINLLLPPDAQIDLDRDGLTKSGVGNTIRFPDSNTPASVAAAWEEATKDLPFGEKMTRQLQMKLPGLLPQLSSDSSIDPAIVTDQVNVQNAEDYSYVKEVNRMLESIEYFKNQTPFDQYQRDHRFWSTFREALERNNAA